MKKLYFLLAGIFIIRLGSIVYFETQQLEEPIILAQDIHVHSDRLYISYITNRAQPHEISNVIINGHHFYPYQETNFSGFISSSNQSSEYVSGRMYSIHTVTFPLHSMGKDLNLSNLTTSTIQFKDGIQLEENVTKDGTQLEEDTTVSKQWDEQMILRSNFSSNSNDGTGKVSYTTVQDVVLTNLTFEEIEHMTLAIGGEQVDLPIKEPITIPNDTIVEVSYKTLTGFYSEDYSVIFFSFLDKHNVPIEFSELAFKNNPPTSEWIVQYVKERAKK